GGGGVQESTERPAARDYCDAGGLHDPVYRRGGGADGTGAVAIADGRRGAGSEHDEEVALRGRAAGGFVWGVDGNDLLPAGVSAVAGPRAFCHVRHRTPSAAF